MVFCLAGMAPGFVHPFDLPFAIAYGLSGNFCSANGFVGVPNIFRNLNAGHPAYRLNLCFPVEAVPPVLFSNSNGCQEN